MNELDQLDRLLNASSPRATPLENDLDVALVRMSVAAERHPQARARPHFWKPAGVGLAALLTVGGAGTAVAAGVWQWHPWAEDPDASFTVTLPSGAECEYRFGDVQGGSTKAVEAARLFAAESDLVALADVESVLTDMRADGPVLQGEDRIPRPNGPGEDLYDADWEYFQALNMAINITVQQHLVAEGVSAVDSSGRGVDFGMQASCDGGFE